MTHAPDTPAPRPKFRASAVVVLVRGTPPAREVFWVRRSDVVPYMPGFHAFVGGGVNAGDSVIAEQLAATGTPDISGLEPGDFDLDALRVLEACAIRETFEETGVLLDLDDEVGAALDREALASARGRVLDNQTSFVDAAREHGWRFRAGGLRYIGRWTTPPFSTARFDSAFFLAEVPAGQQPHIVPGELASGEWITPEAALAQWRAGEASFAAPILHVMLELAGEDERLIERLRSAPRRTGEPVRRIELKWGIVLHPTKTRPLPPATHTNTYLVGDAEMALIDPGSDDPQELAALDQLIGALAADGRRVACVLATHAHPDHVAGIAAVRARYRAPVLAHALTAGAISADRALEDGELVPLASAERDWSLRAIHTPGHARGHLCFLHEGSRSLFCGDHIPGAGTVIIDPPEGDMRDYFASLERLLGLPIETLFPGHGSPRGAAHVRVRELIAHRRAREQRVLMALAPEPQTMAELLERAYEDTPRDLWPYAERSLLAHLLKLEREGRTTRDGESWRAVTW